MRLPQLSAIRLRLLLLLLLLLLYLYLTSFFLMLQAEERRSVKQKAQAFTSGQSRSRPDSGTVERCARQPRCTAKILCAFDAIALQLPKERRRPAVAQGAAAHGHVRHF